MHSAAVFICTIVLIEVIYYLKIFVFECEYRGHSLNTFECSYDIFSVKGLMKLISFNCFILFNFGMKDSVFYVIFVNHKK